jgi:hypothetical protein
MKKFIPFVVICLVSVIAIIYAFIAQDKYINKDTAIAQAQLSCNEVHSEPEEEPYNIEAKLVKCMDLEKLVGWSACKDGHPSADTMIWFVSMDGSWIHWGPEAEDGTNTPIRITRCQVIMDAKSGGMFELRN